MTRPRTIEQPDHMQLNRRNLFGYAVAGTAIVLLTTLLAGCASRPKDYWGKWYPVNRYQHTPTSIPLNADYMYYATPMDGTLRTMLRRWAKDSGMQLSYQLQSDYTLIQPASAIRTIDIHRALADLNSIYTSQGIQLYSLNNEIVAKAALDPAGSSPSKSSPVGTMMPATQPNISVPRPAAITPAKLSTSVAGTTTP